MALPEPFTVDMDTTTSSTMVALGGSVVMVTQTVSDVSLSSTIAVAGTTNVAAMK
jgi:hypothetical protein